MSHLPGPQDQEATRDLRLGEFTDDPTLNLSEVRILLRATLDARANRLTQNTSTTSPTARPTLPKETETLAKTRDYLEIFSLFKDLQDAQHVERTINSYATGMERFEKSQLGSLVPSCADEAKALIPSLEKKVEGGIVGEEELERLCEELGRIKRQSQL